MSKMVGAFARCLMAGAALCGLTACAAAVPSNASAPAAPTLDEIIARNTHARGGAAALDRVHALQIDVELLEGGQTISGPYAANIDGLVRVDIYVAGKNVYSEGVDRQGVWRWTGGPGPAEPSTAEGAANALTHGAENHLFGLHRFAQRGHTLALLSPEIIDGVRYQVVQVRYTTGHTSYFYVDPATWQIVRRRDQRAYHPDNDQTKQRVESRFFDFAPVDGVVASQRSEDIDLATGKTLASSRVLSRRINPDLPTDYFDRNRRAPSTR